MEIFISLGLPLILLLVSFYKDMNVPPSYPKKIWYLFARFSVVHITSIAVIGVHKFANHIFGDRWSLRFVCTSFIFTVSVYIIVSYHVYKTFYAVRLQSIDENGLSLVTIMAFRENFPTFWETLIAGFDPSYALPAIIMSFVSLVITHWVIEKMSVSANGIVRNRRELIESVQNVSPTYVEIYKPQLRQQEANEESRKMLKAESWHLFARLILFILLDLLAIILCAFGFAMMYGFLNIYNFADEQTIQKLKLITQIDNRLILSFYNGLGMFEKLPNSIVASFDPSTKLDVAKAYDTMVIGVLVPTIIHLAGIILYVILMKIEFMVRVPSEWLYKARMVTVTRVGGIVWFLAGLVIVFYGRGT